MCTSWNRRQAGTLALTFVVIGCGSDSPTRDPLSPIQVAGVYSLQTIAGRSLPTTAAGTDVVASDAFNLQADGAFTRILRHQPDGPTGRPVTDVSLGQWTLAGSTVQFTYASPAGSATGTTTDGRTLTVNTAAGAYVYAK